MTRRIIPAVFDLIRSCRHNQIRNLSPSASPQPGAAIVTSVLVCRASYAPRTAKAYERLSIAKYGSVQ